MKRAVVLGIISCLIGFGSFALAKDIKIGLVNLQRIKETNEWKRLEDLFQAEVSKGQLEVERKRKELEAAAFQYERQKPMLSENAQRDKERELQKQKLEFQLWTQDRQRDLDKKRDGMTQNIWSRVKEVVEKIAEKRNLSLVVDYDLNPPTATLNFEKGFVYLAPEVDITEEVLKEFNALFEGKQ
jgi:Skp family chaperone for outer membrane proteins